MSGESASLLLTDLYQLTMLHTYHHRGMGDTAVFELFVRRLPPRRHFLVAAGLEQALSFLENAAFSPEELDWLAHCGHFPAGFVESLRDFRFTGQVHAVPEGTLVFPQEPLLRITAPLPQAQLVESRLINLLHFQTLIASKAARCVLAAPGRLLVDFGLRRAHGFEAGLLAARAAYVAGFDGTATVLAGQRFGIPLFGTMAHSLIQCFDHEDEAFTGFAQAQPDNVVLLLDTYDTEAAAAKVVELAPRLARQGITIRGVRLDSGDLAWHARRVRAILDRGGLRQVTIFASGDLDEFRLEALVRDRAPIDGFGVGTRLTLSADRPYLDCVYKLQEYAGRPRRKRAQAKQTWPGRKQIWRRLDDDGRMAGDWLGLESAPKPGQALLHQVMEDGRRVLPPEPLEAIRNRCAAQLDTLPEPLRHNDSEVRYPVNIAPELEALARQLDQESH